MVVIDNILEYIPQRPPFVMIDKLVAVDEKTNVCSFSVTRNNIFCENGEFYEAGLIENMAQTVAAGAGYRLRQENNAHPQIGVIGAVKNLIILKRPAIGSMLNTLAEIHSSFENALIVKCSVEENGIRIAECQMNIFIIDNPETLNP